jgi:hypothetical protein
MSPLFCQINSAVFKICLKNAELILQKGEMILRIKLTKALALGDF